MISRCAWLQRALAVSAALLLGGGAGTAFGELVPLADIEHVASGYDRSCALTRVGTVKCWGDNTTGALGDGTIVDRATPVDVIGLEHVQAISVGTHHACALTFSGAVKCWGDNTDGQLGDGTISRRLVATDVVGLASGVKAIASGAYHTCALTASDTIKCWGLNVYGQLGDGTTATIPIPVDVVGIAQARSISAGGFHTCALTASDAVLCWGNNSYQQLGNGAWSGDESSPTPVVGLGAGVREIDSNASHTCATMLDGAVKCWGSNSSGQLGDGSTLWRSTPVDVIGLGETVKFASTGDSYSCALADSGNVKCWGSNFDGSLGDASTQDSLMPVNVLNATNIQSIDAGDRHICAVEATRGVVCWGNDFSGQLGIGHMTRRVAPVDGPSLDGVHGLSGGFLHTCALTGTSDVVCWGRNADGQLGDGTTTQRLLPVVVSGLGDGASAVSAGYRHTCAIDMSNVVKCWGDNAYGQLGNGGGISHLSPTTVAGLTADTRSISAGLYHNCAVTGDYRVKCWGDNQAGQLGDGSLGLRLSPVEVTGLANVQTVAAGYFHTCALTQAGSVKCWGSNYSGELGDGTNDRRLTPTDVVGLASGVRAISAGNQTTCAITSNGAVKCWGFVLGDSSSSTPVDVIGLSWGVLAISSGSQHICAQLKNGVQCWGENNVGQLGDGSLETRFIPAEVTGLGGSIDSISVGGNHTCASRESGPLRCWGSNSAGQLGDGTFEGIPLPQAVVVPGDSIFANGFE